MRTKEKMFYSCNILKVSVSTNCPMGGDAGHGGRTVLSFENIEATDMECHINRRITATPLSKIDLVFMGDSECHTLIEALEYASYQLKKILKKNQYESYNIPIGEVKNGG